MTTDKSNEAVAQIIVALIDKDQIVVRDPNMAQEEVTSAITRIKLAFS